VVGSIIPITGTDEILTDLNSGKAWSLMDLGDLANCILRGTSVDETAEFLCREVDEVRTKIAELKNRDRVAALAGLELAAGKAVPRDSMGRDLRLPAVYSNPPRPGFRALRRLVLCGTSFRCAQETRCPDHGDYIANAGLCGTRTQAIEARLRRPASPFIGSPLPCLRSSSARIGGLSCFGWTHSPPYGKWREAGLLDDITELRTFVNIVGAGSLSAAARQMELALSVVSKRLASLERRAEVRLSRLYCDGAQRK
jgi:hypothetical protein